IPCVATRPLIGTLEVDGEVHVGAAAHFALAAAVVAPPRGTVAAAHAASLRATRIRALRALGLVATSASVGNHGCLPTGARRAALPQTHTGRSGGQVQPRRSAATNRFTMRSSNEW